MKIRIHLLATDHEADGTQVSMFHTERELFEHILELTGLNEEQELVNAVRDGNFDAVIDHIADHGCNDSLFTYSISEEEIDVEDPTLEKVWFVNHYHCPECNHSWDDEWDCTCNDRCPKCNAEIEPESSDEAHYTGPPRKQ